MKYYGACKSPKDMRKYLYLAYETTTWKYDKPTRYIQQFGDRLGELIKKYCSKVIKADELDLLIQLLGKWEKNFIYDPIFINNHREGVESLRMQLIDSIHNPRINAEISSEETEVDIKLFNISEESIICSSYLLSKLKSKEFW